DLFFIFAASMLVPNEALNFSPHARARMWAHGIPVRHNRLVTAGYSHFRPLSVGFWNIGVYPDADFVPSFPTDENGFKNTAGVYTAHSQLDIVTLGSSFIEATGTSIEDSWPAVVGQTLHCVVYNLGGGGNGSLETRHVAEALALPKKPKVLLWGFVE